MVVRYYRSTYSAALFSALYILLSFQCAVTSFSSKTRFKEETNVRKPIYVIAQSENEAKEPLFRHRRKLPAESNDQLNTLDDDVPLQEYQGVFGRPGIDFPVLSSIPVTKFNCRHVKNSNTGYYADTETHCQVFHVCDAGRKISFLCPNGTIFRQSHLICDWWFRVDCERSPELYEQSVQQLQADQNVHKQRVETIATAMQNAVNRNAKELPAPVPVTNKVNDFNSESELPKINLGNDLRANRLTENRDNLAITSPPRSSFRPNSVATEGTTNVRYQNENTNPSVGSTASFSYATTTYKPDVTPLIHNFLPNDGNDGREQQVLAETASFAGGKYPLQNYYYSMNLIKHPSKPNTKSTNQPIDTTYQTESYTDFDDFYKTTNLPDNFRNLNNTDAYALYYTSINGATVSTFVTSPALRAVSPSLSSNASKPQVSEFILTQSNSEYAGENPTERNLPLLTNMTKEAFNQLFPKDEKLADQSIASEFKINDLATEHSNGIVQSNTQKPVKQESLADNLLFKSSPDLRELAQVFSRALSAYLENPEQFRKILSEVRPTEPPSLNENVNGEASADDEVLAFSEDVASKSTPKYKTTPNVAIDQITFTTQVPMKSTIKDPETFAEEINNFMFIGPHAYGQSESSEFNVNETYYPSSRYHSNGTTLPVTYTQFTVSPLIDFTQNTTYSVPFTETVSTPLPFANGIPKHNLYDDSRNIKSQPQDVSQSLDKEHFLTADTQSFVSRDNLVKYQNYNPNYKIAETTQFKSSTANQLPVSQSKYNTDYQNVKSSRNMQFGLRTTAVTRAPYISSRADISPSTIALTTRVLKTTTYRPETSTLYSTSRVYENRDSKSYDSDVYQNLSPNSGHFNETAKALVNMMEEAKTNNMLRHQLVLLLVNDKGLPENKSVKEMKSKLLKALLKPAPDKTTKNDKNENERISRQDTTRSPKRKERVVVHKHKITPTPLPIAESKLTTNYQVTRSERSTSKPVVVASLTGPNESDLSESDTRAVDLLKTLYMIASNNWTH